MSRESSKAIDRAKKIASMSLDEQRAYLESEKRGKPESDSAGSRAAQCSHQRRVRRRENDVYVVEKVEAYNVAIEALLNHEPADGDPTGMARRLRRALAHKLDKEIQRWCDALPPNDKASNDAPPT